jgi:tRNA(fMet)-specific endonuclease VapC
MSLVQQRMSAITFAELTYGVQACATAKRKQNQAVLDSLVQHLAVLDWPQDAGPHYAEVRLDLNKRGAHAWRSRLDVCCSRAVHRAYRGTNTTKAFAHVKGLQIENWMK